MQYLRIYLFALLALLVSCGPDSYESKASYAPDQSGNWDMEEEIQVEPPRTAQPPPSPASPEMYDQASAETTSAREQGQTDGQSDKTNKPSTQKIIYTGSIRMQVDSLTRELALVSELVKKAGGYISNQHQTDSHHKKEAQLTIRLPVEGFQPAMNSITKIAKFVNAQKLDSRDVSAQWIDLESRLKTKREVRDRYIEILRKRAVKVEDILEAEDKIRVITEEIEAKEGQLRYLRDQVGMSTLHLSMYETQEYRENPDTYRVSFGQKILAALGNGGELIQGLLLGAISVWPLWLLIPLFVWGWRRWRRN